VRHRKKNRPSKEVLSFLLFGWRRPNLRRSKIIKFARGKMSRFSNCSRELSNLKNLRSRKIRYTVFIPLGCGVDWARCDEHRAYAAAPHLDRTKRGGWGIGGLYGGVSGVLSGGVGGTSARSSKLLYFLFYSFHISTKCRT